MPTCWWVWWARGARKRMTETAPNCTAAVMMHTSEGRSCCSRRPWRTTSAPRDVAARHPSRADAANQRHRAAQSRGTPHHGAQTGGRHTRRPCYRRCHVTGDDHAGVLDVTVDDGMGGTHRRARPVVVRTGQQQGQITTPTAAAEVPGEVDVDGVGARLGATIGATQNSGPGGHATPTNKSVATTARTQSVDGCRQRTPASDPRQQWETVAAVGESRRQ